MQAHLKKIAQCARLKDRNERPAEQQAGNSFESDYCTSRCICHPRIVMHKEFESTAGRIDLSSRCRSADSPALSIEVLLTTSSQTKPLFSTPRSSASSLSSDTSVSCRTLPLVYGPSIAEFKVRSAVVHAPRFTPTRIRIEVGRSKDEEGT